MPPDPPQPAPAPPTEHPRDAAADARWIRVGPTEPDPARPPAVSLADIESELEPLDLEVVALGADATGPERDLQRVVDRYERLLDDRARASDRTAPDVAHRPAPRLLAGLLDRLRTVARRVGP